VCTAQKCCAEVSACASDLPCAVYDKCADNCWDTTQGQDAYELCTAACMAKDLSAKPKATAEEHCLEMYCKTPCGLI
jgi:hypothetical protein